VVPEDAETVRAIFARYVELGSIGPLAEDLDRLSEAEGKSGAELVGAQAAH
jgi:hypothetical protein